MATDYINSIKGAFAPSKATATKGHRIGTLATPTRKHTGPKGKLTFGKKSK